MTDTKETSDLLPCPFCGERAAWKLAKKQHCQLHGEPSQAVHIFCRSGGCPAAGGVFVGDVFNGGEGKARLEAAAAWNRRAPTPEAAALILAKEALAGVEDTLSLVESPAFPDPTHHAEVKALGRRVGFGALMSTASAGWRESLAESGYPVGSEFVAGPCLVTVRSCLILIRAALDAINALEVK